MNKQIYVHKLSTYFTFFNLLSICILYIAYFGNILIFKNHANSTITVLQKSCQQHKHKGNNYCTLFFLLLLVVVFIKGQSRGVQMSVRKSRGKRKINNNKQISSYKT